MSITYTCNRCKATSMDEEDINDNSIGFGKEKNLVFISISVDVREQRIDLCQECRRCLQSKLEDIINDVNDFLRGDTENETH